jgi:hypothetical protein
VKVSQELCQSLPQALTSPLKKKSGLILEKVIKISLKDTINIWKSTTLFVSQVFPQKAHMLKALSQRVVLLRSDWMLKALTSLVG